MKRLIITTTVLGMTAATGANALISGGVLMDLNVNSLPVTCSFANGVTGSMDYNPALEVFDQTTGTPQAAELDLTYRNLETLQIFSSGFFDGNGSAITSVGWGTSTIFKTVAVTTTGLLTAEWTLTPSETEATDTVSVFPASIAVAQDAIASTGTFTETIIVACVE